MSPVEHHIPLNTGMKCSLGDWHCRNVNVAANGRMPCGIVVPSALNRRGRVNICRLVASQGLHNRHFSCEGKIILVLGYQNFDNVGSLLFKRHLHYGLPLLGSLIDSRVCG